MLINIKIPIVTMELNYLLTCHDILNLNTFLHVLTNPVSDFLVYSSRIQWLTMPAELTLDDVSCQECSLSWCTVQPSMQQISFQLQVNLVTCDLLLEAEWVRRVELHSEAQQDGFHFYKHVT
jgi:hypothetical protein